MDGLWILTLAYAAIGIGLFAISGFVWVGLIALILLIAYKLGRLE